MQAGALGQVVGIQIDCAHGFDGAIADRQVLRVGAGAKGKRSGGLRLPDAEFAKGGGGGEGRTLGREHNRAGGVDVQARRGAGDGEVIGAQGDGAGAAGHGAPRFAADIGIDQAQRAPGAQARQIDRAAIGQNVAAPEVDVGDAAPCMARALQGDAAADAGGGDAVQVRMETYALVPTGIERIGRVANDPNRIGRGVGRGDAGDIVATNVKKDTGGVVARCAHRTLAHAVDGNRADAAVDGVGLVKAHAPGRIPATAVGGARLALDADIAAA